MDYTKIVISMLVIVLLVSIICLSYQIYQIVKLDAKARGLKQPKLWGIFALSGNNGGGLITYLVIRRNYPIINMSSTEKLDISKRKKTVGVALVFLSASAIGIVLWICLLLK